MANNVVAGKYTLAELGVELDILGKKVSQTLATLELRKIVTDTTPVAVFKTDGLIQIALDTPADTIRDGLSGWYLSKPMSFLIQEVLRKAYGIYDNDGNSPTFRRLILPPGFMPPRFLELIIAFNSSVNSALGRPPIQIDTDGDSEPDTFPNVSKICRALDYWSTGNCIYFGLEEEIWKLNLTTWLFERVDILDITDIIEYMTIKTHKGKDWLFIKTRVRNIDNSNIHEILASSTNHDSILRTKNIRLYIKELSTSQNNSPVKISDEVEYDTEFNYFSTMSHGIHYIGGAFFLIYPYGISNFIQFDIFNFNSCGNIDKTSDEFQDFLIQQREISEALANIDLVVDLNTKNSWKNEANRLAIEGLKGTTIKIKDRFGLKGYDYNVTYNNNSFKTLNLPIPFKQTIWLPGFIDTYYPPSVKKDPHQYTLAFSKAETLRGDVNLLPEKLTIETKYRKENTLALSSGYYGLMAQLNPERRRSYSFLDFSDNSELTIEDVFPLSDEANNKYLRDIKFTLGQKSINEPFLVGSALYYLKMAVQDMKIIEKVFFHNIGISYGEGGGSDMNFHPTVEELDMGVPSRHPLDQNLYRHCAYTAYPNVEIYTIDSTDASRTLITTIPKLHIKGREFQPMFTVSDGTSNYVYLFGIVFETLDSKTFFDKDAGDDNLDRTFSNQKYARGVILKLSLSANGFYKKTISNSPDNNKQVGHPEYDSKHWFYFASDLESITSKDFFVVKSTDNNRYLINPSIVEDTTDIISATISFDSTDQNNGQFIAIPGTSDVSQILNSEGDSAIYTRPTTKVLTSLPMITAVGQNDGWIETAGEIIPADPNYDESNSNFLKPRLYSSVRDNDYYSIRNYDSVSRAGATAIFLLNSPEGAKAGDGSAELKYKFSTDCNFGLTKIKISVEEYTKSGDTFSWVNISTKIYAVDFMLGTIEDTYYIGIAAFSSDLKSLRIKFEAVYDGITVWPWFYWNYEVSYLNLVVPLETKEKETLKPIGEFKINETYNNSIGRPNGYYLRPYDRSGGSLVLRDGVSEYTLATTNLYSNISDFDSTALDTRELTVIGCYDSTGVYKFKVNASSPGIDHGKPFTFKILSRLIMSGDIPPPQNVVINLVMYSPPGTSGPEFTKTEQIIYTPYMLSSACLQEHSILITNPDEVPIDNIIFELSYGDLEVESYEVASIRVLCGKIDDIPSILNSEVGWNPDSIRCPINTTGDYQETVLKLCLGSADLTSPYYIDITALDAERIYISIDCATNSAKYGIPTLLVEILHDTTILCSATIEPEIQRKVHQISLPITLTSTENLYLRLTSQIMWLNQYIAIYSSRILFKMPTGIAATPPVSDIRFHCANVVVGNKIDVSLKVGAVINNGVAEYPRIGVYLYEKTDSTTYTELALCSFIINAKNWRSYSAVGIPLEQAISNVNNIYARIWCYSEIYQNYAKLHSVKIRIYSAGTYKKFHFNSYGMKNTEDNDIALVSKNFLPTGDFRNTEAIRSLKWLGDYKDIAFLDGVIYGGNLYASVLLVENITNSAVDSDHPECNLKYAIWKIDSTSLETDSTTYSNIKVFENQPKNFVLKGSKLFFTLEDSGYIATMDLASGVPATIANTYIAYDSSNPFLSDELTTQSNLLVVDPATNPLCYLISAPSGKDRYNFKIPTGKYYLCQLGLNYIPLIELADFEGLSCEDVLQNFCESINWIKGFDKFGNFFMVNRQPSYTTPDLILLEDIDTKYIDITEMENTSDELINKMTITPYRNVLQMPKYNIVYKARQYEEENVNLVMDIEQRDLSKKTIDLICVRDGEVGIDSLNLNSCPLFKWKIIDLETEIRVAVNLPIPTVIPVDLYLTSVYGGKYSDGGIKPGDMLKFLNETTNEYEFKLILAVYEEENRITIESGFSFDLKKDTVGFVLNSRNKYYSNEQVAVCTVIPDENSGVFQVDSIDNIGINTVLQNSQGGYGRVTSKYIGISNTYNIQVSDSEGNAILDFCDKDEVLKGYWSPLLSNVAYEVGGSSIFIKLSAKEDEAISKPKLRTFIYSDYIQVICDGLKLESDEASKQTFVDINSVAQYGTLEGNAPNNKFLNRLLAKNLAKQIVKKNAIPRYKGSVSSIFLPGLEIVNKAARRLFVVRIQNSKLFPVIQDNSIDFYVTSIKHSLRNRSTSFSIRGVRGIGEV